MGGKLIVILSVAAFIGVAYALPQEAVLMMLQYQMTCIAWSGSDEGYRQVLTSLQPAQTCVLNRLNVQQLQSDAMQLASGSRKQFFEKYCPKFNESLNCFDDTFEGVAKCSGEDTDQVKAIVKDITRGLLGLFCQNDGQFFFDAQQPEFKTCIAQLREHVEECEVSNIGTSLTGFGEQQCRELEEARKCLKGKVDDCNAPKVKDVLDVFYMTISKANDCKQYTNVGEVTSNEINGITSEN